MTLDCLSLHIKNEYIRQRINGSMIHYNRAEMSKTLTQRLSNCDTSVPFHRGEMSVPTGIRTNQTSKRGAKSHLPGNTGHRSKVCRHTRWKRRRRRGKREVKFEHQKQDVLTRAPITAETEDHTPLTGVRRREQTYIYAWLTHSRFSCMHMQRFKLT